MSSSQFNNTIEQQYSNSLEIFVFSLLSTVPACLFLFINGTLMFSLRSKPVLRYTCRYILLYNLLVADTAQLVVTQVLSLLAISRVKLTYGVCGTITTIANLTSGISPLILVVMSLERYVAVCYPLRHASIITIKNTAVAIIATWTVSSLNNVTRNLFLLEFENLGSVMMKDFCSDVAWFPNSLCEYYDKVYTAFVFISAGLTVIFSYAGVVIAANSASTDKASALKARKTLLLHIIQLGLSLSYTIYYPLLIALAGSVKRVVFVWVQRVFYVFIIILPRCLTSLIYGLRDKTIRPVLLQHLCCKRKSLI
ncbi:PREDICTED: olfactory receptor 2AK2-like [Cyprinodon variegatus]|uniref:olfactory receptor 2AK2-like n=1 Tax=Cyprinodon variegatus TaxID=28743 RepID=UPI0007427375|nr:PREDICTED: olfactory receptor 2AK2-like [Cyprinodon variegatus]